MRMRTYFERPTQVAYFMGGEIYHGIAYQNYIISSNGEVDSLQVDVEDVLELDWQDMEDFLMNLEV